MQFMDLFFDDAIDLLESSSDDEEDIISTLISTLISNILESSSDDESSTSSIYDNQDGIDFLSNLPDSLICQIISKLKTKEAVKTCVLSSRYKSLWRNITSLRFNDCDIPGDNDRLGHFVNRVLIFLKLKSINEFFLILETPCNLYETSRVFSVSNLCSLEVAQIEVISSEGDAHYEKVVQLLQGLNSVNHLWISGDALEALSHMPSEEIYTMHDVLRMDTNYSEQSSSQDFLDPSTESHDFYLSKESSDNTHVVQWSAPQELPVCLLSVLETISVSGFKGQENELSMIVHILKNTKVLKKLTITEATSESEANLELYEKILTFDLGSERCEIIFS